MEKKRLLGDVYGRRPGDVTIPVWRSNKGLAIDVAVASPLASSNLQHSEPCETYATFKKHAYYDEDFKGTAFEFAAMVFETTGGVNTEGLEVLRQLFRFAAKHQGLQLSVYCGRAWARLSCNIQSSVSQCFLNRAGSSGHRERYRLSFRLLLVILLPLPHAGPLFFILCVSSLHWTPCSLRQSPLERLIVEKK